jgi:hypothetical protein
MLNNAAFNLHMSIRIFFCSVISSSATTRIEYADNLDSENMTYVQRRGLNRCLCVCVSHLALQPLPTHLA